MVTLVCGLPLPHGKQTKHADDVNCNMKNKK